MPFARNKNTRVVGINTLFLIPNKVGGTEYYTRSFLQALHDLTDQKDLEFVVFCNAENFETFSFSQKNWRKVLCPVHAQNRFSRIFFEYLVLPFFVARYDCSVLHSFGYTTPKILGAKNIVTIHDANWQDHPQDSGWLSHLFLSMVMRLTLLFADTIVTDSQFSAQRLRALYPARAKDIQAINPGLDVQFYALLQKKQVLPPNTPQRYILCVSALYPHKKVPYALEIWQELAQIDPTLSLVLVGQNGRDEEQVKGQGKKLPRFHHFAKVSYPQLVALYQHAELFLFPSVYEGFGFPVYEAVAAGLPVFVGKKECYENSLQEKIEELSFEKKTDVQNIAAILKNSLRQKKTFDLSLQNRYAKNAAELQKLYLS